VNLVLIGYRGTGKSTVGRLLAEQIGFAYVELDAEIARHAGMSIPEIVERHSWAYFRDLEEEVVKVCSAKQDQVLDTGGGVITRPVNSSRLRKSGLVFLLQADVQQIAARIGGDDQRPSLTGNKTFLEEIEEVLAEREPLYQAAAHFVIETSGRTPEDVAAEILELYEKA
jgi:shikimate kinase